MSDSSENYLSNLRSLEDELARMARDLDLNFTTTEEGTAGGTTLGALDETAGGNADEPLETEPGALGSAIDAVNYSTSSSSPAASAATSSSSGVVHGSASSSKAPSTINPPSSSVPDSLAVNNQTQGTLPTTDASQQRPVMDDLYAALGLEDDDEEEGRQAGYVPTGDSDILGDNSSSSSAGARPVPTHPTSALPTLSSDESSSSSDLAPPPVPAPASTANPLSQRPNSTKWLSEGELADVSSGGDRHVRQTTRATRQQQTQLPTAELSTLSSVSDLAAPRTMPYMPPTLEGRAEAGLKETTSEEEAGNSAARRRARAAPRPFPGAPAVPLAFGSRASSLVSGSVSGASLPPSHSPSVTRPTDSEAESQSPASSQSSPASSLPSLPSVAHDALVDMSSHLAGLVAPDSVTMGLKSARVANAVTDILGADVAFKYTVQGSPVPSLGDELRALRTLGTVQQPDLTKSESGGLIPTGVRALNTLLETVNTSTVVPAMHVRALLPSGERSADTSVDSIDSLGMQLDAILPPTAPTSKSTPAAKPPTAHPQAPADVTRQLEQGLERARAGLEDFKRQFASVLASPAAAAANPTPGLSPVNPIRTSATPGGPVDPLQPLAEVEGFMQSVREKYGALLSASAHQTPAKRRDSAGTQTARVENASTATETVPPAAVVSRGVSAGSSRAGSVVLPPVQTQSQSQVSFAKEDDQRVYEESSSVSTRASSKDAAAVTPMIRSRSRGVSGVEPSQIPEVYVPIPVQAPPSSTAHSVPSSNASPPSTVSSQRRLSFSGVDGGASGSSATANSSSSKQQIAAGGSVVVASALTNLVAIHPEPEPDVTREDESDGSRSSTSDQGAKVTPAAIRHVVSAPPAAIPIHPSLAPTANPSTARLHALNTLLRDCGFSGILPDSAQTGGSAVVDGERLLGTLTDVLGQYQRRSKLVQELLQAQEMERQREARIEQAVREAQTQRDEADSRAKKALSAYESLKQKVEKQEEIRGLVKKMEGEAGRLRQRLAQSEHLVKAKEQEADKFKVKLEERVAREERRALRDREIYDRLKRAYAAAGGKDGSKSPSLNVAVRELKPLEIVSLYEAQREALELELASLRSENRSLRDDLREAQNLIARKDRTNAWGNPAAGAEERLIAAERRVAELARELAEEKGARIEDSKRAERRLAESDRKAESLAEENASLVLELESRPSVRETKSLQRQVDILERKIAQLRSGKEPGQEAEEGAVALDVLASSRNATATLHTRDRIRRDREIHRLGLRHVEQLPRDVLIDLVQDVCIGLEISDATILSAQLARVIKCVSALPKLERFASEVCDIVLRLGSPFLPAEARGASLTGKDAPAVVPKVLREWLQSLQLLQDHTDLLTAVRAELHRRPGGGVPSNAPDHALVLHAVKQLVDVERAAMGSQETLKATEGLLSSQPDVLTHRIIQHFMHLFDVGRLEGVLPRMNQVYVGLNEARNFQRSLSLMLGYTDASTQASKGKEIVAKGAAAADLPTYQQLGETVRRLVQMGLGYDKRLLQALHDVNVNGAPKPAAKEPRIPSGGPLVAVVLRNGDIVWEAKKEAETVPLVFGSAAEAAADEDRRRRAAQVDGEEDEEDDKENAGPSSAPQASTSAQDAAVCGVADGVNTQSVQAMKKVMELLRVDDVQDALIQLERVITRLYKLDEVLPQYQAELRKQHGEMV